MSTILFDNVIFGPVLSRRLGVSLGINLSPIDSKVCTFNCIYCECGWTQKKELNREEVPTTEQFGKLLEERLQKLSMSKIKIDSITFAGNGEPTMHPEFADIIDRTILLRDKYYPQSKITVLSNASIIHDDRIIDALRKVDNNMLKLDTVVEETFRLLNKPLLKISVNDIVAYLKKFNGDLIIQSLVVKAEINGKHIDNTTDKEIDEWLRILNEIKPRLVIIYPISREPADKNVKKIDDAKLNAIAEKVRNAGIDVNVYY